MKIAPGHCEIIRCRLDADNDDMKQRIRADLSAPQKSLPCKYFYDSRGSLLFQLICRLPEYYQTRTEFSILQSAAPLIMKNLRAGSLIELGSGANWKIRTLLDAADGSRKTITYRAVDVCEPILKQALEDLLELYPDLAVSGIVADFNKHMDRIMLPGDKLITFFGGTIGNFPEQESSIFLKNVARTMTATDRLLVGMDLVKETKILEAAYNDTQGVTARFNKNILRVLNRELQTAFQTTDFDHLAFYNEKLEQVEMHLVAKRDIFLTLVALDMPFVMKKGETIFTERCRKFHRKRIDEMAAEAGLRISRWFTDNREWFAVVELMTL